MTRPIPPVHDGPAGGFDRLAGELKAAFARGWEEPLSDSAFDDLALRVFAHQFEQCRPYHEFCRARGRTPDAVRHWSEVPAVPTTAFKHLELVAGDPARVQAVFRTSGTTRGESRRGVHHVLDTDLYAASLLPPFRKHLLPDADRMPILSLAPRSDEQKDSSLSYMLAVVTAACGSPGSRAYVDSGGHLDLQGFVEACRRAVTHGTPVLVAGTAFSFVHLLDGLQSRGGRLPLPEGSRAMETGGFKGRSRELPRDQLYASIHRALGIAPSWIVNEYGMTELMSQFYDAVAGQSPRGHRLHVPPPWMRTRVLDPITLDVQGPGEAGLLCHFDLANLGSVSAVLTEDLGVAADGGFQLMGRATGAEPRGCSIAMDDLLAAARRGGT